MENVGNHKDNEITGSKEYICNEHVFLIEMEENDYVDITVCK